MSMKGTRDMNTTGSISRWVVTARRITVVMALFAALGGGVVAVPQPAQAAAPVIASTSTISAGAVNPVVSVTTSSSVFAPGVSVADFTITPGSTGLAGAPAFTRVSDTHVSFAFTGTAAAGEVSITAGAGAFNPDPGAGSNTIAITVPAAVNASSAPAVGSLAIVVDTNLTPGLTITLWGDLAGRSKNWGDGTAANTNTHTYAAAGIYTIEFPIPSGSLLPIENCEYSCLDGLVDVSQWGNSIVGPNAFQGAQNLTGFTATDAPAVAVEPTSMFRNATRFNGNINSWDVSGVRLMNSMFEGATAFNQPLNLWNTGNVRHMGTMFRGASAFNQPLNSWNVSSVKSMSDMFNGATAFNQPLNDWNTSPNSTSQVTSMSHMFEGATSFNQPLNNWNTSNVENMSNMFQGATAFNQPLNNWNTSKVADMRRMFEGATAFNQTLNNWNTRGVTNMVSMFRDATAFNKPLNSWNVSSVRDMESMFRGATAFNRPLNSWDTRRVTMSYMFRGATAFNQPLDNWNLGLVTNMEDMLQDASAMSVANWSATLIGWARNPPTPSSAGRGNVRAEGLFYSADAQVAHDFLIGRGLSNLGSMGFAPSIDSATPGNGSAVVDRVARVFGSDRFATSVAVSLEFAVVGAPAVYVASGVSLADAMVAGSYAAEDGGSVLFVERDRVPAGVLGELRRLAPREVVVVGGHQVVAPSVEQSLVAAGFRVRRVAGADRYATAVALSKRGYASTVSTVYVASGVAFADAMPAGVLAAIDDGPVLLVTPGGVPAVTAAELVRLRPERIVIVGGPAEVGAAVEASLRSYAARVVRVSGVDRYETAVALSQSRFDPGVPAVFVMSGDRFPDALAAVAPAGRLGGPILLSSPTCVPASVRAEIGRLQPGRIIIIGGGAVLGSGIDALATC
jgi:surface protein